MLHHLSSLCVGGDVSSRGGCLMSAGEDGGEGIRTCDSLLVLVFDSYHLHCSLDGAHNPFSG